MANRGTSVDGGWKLVSFGLCVFSGSFGIQSILLCKCSGKYIDINFILKITYSEIKYHTVLYPRLGIPDLYHLIVFRYIMYV